MATAATGKPGNGPKSNPELEDDIRLLRADLDKLIKQLSVTGEHGMGAARRAAAEGADQIRSQGEAAIESLRANARDVEAQLTESVREKPVTSLAIAAGVGFLFALLARR